MKNFSEMEIYDPYKIEADCLKRGGDEIGCFKSTYYGVFGYSLFLTQADKTPSMDQETYKCVSDWANERLKKFQCKGGDCKSGQLELKPAPKP